MDALQLARLLVPDLDGGYECGLWVDAIAYFFDWIEELGPEAHWQRVIACRLDIDDQCN
jgi:hypothetical protein